MDQSGVLSLHINPLIDMSLIIWSKGMEFFHQINGLLDLKYSDAKWNEKKWCLFLFEKIVWKKGIVWENPPYHAIFFSQLVLINSCRIVFLYINSKYIT